MTFLLRQYNNRRKYYRHECLQLKGQSESHADVSDTCHSKKISRLATANKDISFCNKQALKNKRSIQSNATSTLILLRSAQWRCSLQSLLRESSTKSHETTLMRLLPYPTPTPTPSCFQLQVR